MHSERVVLAIENDTNTRLTRLLSDLGFSVLAVSDLEPALSRIQHLNISAVVMDGTGRNDPLEFVLNVREYSELLPIIVVGPTSGSDLYKVLDSQVEVTVIPDQENGVESRIAESVQAAIA